MVTNAKFTDGQIIQDLRMFGSLLIGSGHQNAELTPAHIFHRPVILAVPQEIRFLFSSTDLYVVNIEQISRTVAMAHGPVMDTTSSSN
ncbi:hypothetical protein TNCV_4191551 [Trichonephila clavipes]|nr:hypothetical protein TNCV_4191551 [Trichonephila clavipes]